MSFRTEHFCRQSRAAPEGSRHSQERDIVPQCVRSDPLGDLSGLCRIDDDAMELPGADGR